ncbi:zinc finger and BTB domain-containing protein 1 isoform X1 [Gadus macrocephalus]|uniref:zinc finger and BTB domain-containing protein 1 isoform X1 n=2 Tax=Gadus macrocephalus TaxID=80720 RepID=UPI0028CB4945|nr:zinc finger and BTB domain-containing protein 1 isoform X1 [Gadus macrocephalus]
MDSERVMARPSHSDHVLQQLNNQREWGFLCDCCISIGDIYFRAHKAVLAACSSYFRMMFIRDQQAAGRLDLSNMQINAECFDLILQLMYLGRIVVGSYEFEELKASMAYLQMYYIPDSLDDLRDIRSSNLTPSSSASASSSSSSSSSSAAPVAGKMMFGVRMYEQQRTAAETDRPKMAVASVATRPAAPPAPVIRVAALPPPPPAEEVVVVAGTPLIVAPPLVVLDGLVEQPCDLRKRSGGMGRSASMKERPRFGRTYTCDDCGFVFSCEKLLIEHILTCTNRKAFPTPRAAAEADNDSSKAESSASEGLDEHRVVCKEEWPEDPADAMNRSVAAGSDRGEPATAKTVSIKTEPEDPPYSEIEVVRVGQPHASDSTGRASDPRVQDCTILKEKEEPDQEHSEPGFSRMDDAPQGPFEGHMSSSDDSGIPSKLRKVKEEKQPEEEESAPCELCGVELTEDDRSGHYLSSHMGHICACGRCGQVLIKGRQLQEHAERCGEAQEAESDSHGEDDSSLMEEEEAQGMEDEEEAPGLEEGLQDPADLACLHCGLVFQNEGRAFQHALACHEQQLLRPAPSEDGGEPDHRRKHFCTLCGKGFYQRCHLREHYTVHTREKQFSCQTCGKQFLRERQLRLHTDMHKGMARYVCPVCDRGTFLKHDHVRHMISHLAAGETICQVCFQVFPSTEQLESHMDVHLYICGVCGEKFRLRKDMRGHYNSKHTKRL